MAKPPAPALQVKKWDAGQWSEAPDAVVTEEPLQLMLDGEPLSVVMRTPGQDIELALGLLYAEGIARSLDAIRKIRISVESQEIAPAIEVDASIVESNQVDIHLARAPRRKPERSMLSSSACGVCGAVLIEDLRRDLAPLPAGLRSRPRCRDRRASCTPPKADAAPCRAADSDPQVECGRLERCARQRSHRGAAAASARR